VRQIVEQRLAQLTEEMQGFVERVRTNARRELAEQLNMAVRRLRLAPDADELFATLADSAASFACGAAVFRIEGEVATGGPVRGVTESAVEGFRGLEIRLASAAALASAVAGREPVTAVTSATEVSPELAALAEHAPDGRASVFPLVAGERVPALLYAWGETQASFLELLSQVAAAAWTALPEPPPPAPELVTIAPAPAEPEPEPGSAWDSLSAADQQLHLRAQRFARVQVAEMRLFAPDAVQAGRAESDLYGTLRQQIDAAREKFRQSFFGPCPSMVDYLHLELVQTLANDDAELLGKHYPGPMV